MSQWKNTNDAANSTNFAIQQFHHASGKTAKAANTTSLFNNTSPGAFISNRVDSQMAAQDAVFSNTSGESAYVTHSGWQLRTAGMGGITTATATAGSGFANGETAVVTGGGQTGVLTLTCNATGNLVSATVTNGGLFSNTGQASVALIRERHLSSITVGGTPLGYSNTDVISGSAVNNFITATATVSTNATGGFVSANVTITNVGLFGNTTVAANVTFTVANSSGGASAGSGATFTAVIAAASTAGTVAVTGLGGRAGRKTYETLVTQSAMKSGAGSNTTQLPIT